MFQYYSPMMRENHWVLKEIGKKMSVSGVGNAGLNLRNNLALFNFTESVHGFFCRVTGGRPSSFQEVTQWGIPWLRANARGTGRGEASPVG